MRYKKAAETVDTMTAASQAEKLAALRSDAV
jgi:hypothetical protein